MHVKVRRQGAVRSAAILIAVGVNEHGMREILGLELSFRETGVAWADFFRRLRRRGPHGVDVAVSDAHEGLIDALQEGFPGVIWQRCQAHFMRNVLDATPESVRDATCTNTSVRSCMRPERAREAFERARSELAGRAERALSRLEAGFEDATAVLVLPEKYRKRLRTTNMLERLIEEVRRRERVIRIFPNEASVWPLVGALLAEKHEVWTTGRLYLNMEAFYAWKRSFEEPEPTALAA